MTMHEPKQSQDLAANGPTQAAGQSKPPVQPPAGLGTQGSGAAAGAGASPPPTPKETALLLKIGDFARLADTNLRTLRYYEELGLLEPARRSQGGFRYYRPTDLNRLRMIRDLQDLGLSLEAIGELLATRQKGLPRHEMLARVGHALAEQQRLIEQRIEELKAQVQGLAEAKQKLDSCASCSHTPSFLTNYCEPCKATGESLPKPLSALF